MKLTLTAVVVTAGTLVAAACAPSDVALECSPTASPEQLAARPSPYDSAMVTVGDAAAKVCYSRPAVRGRLVFGGLVPYDTLWRTGANEPTTIHLSRGAEIAGIAVEAGSYTLYTVPDTDQWSVVVNASTSQWGMTAEMPGEDGSIVPSSYTDEVRAQEVGRAPIETEQHEYTERFTTSFGSPTGSEVDLYFDWAATRITVPMRFTGGAP